MNRVVSLLLIALVIPLIAPKRCDAVVDLKAVAAVTTIAANSGSIVRETHDLTTHFKRTMKRHGHDLKKAITRGK